MKLGIVSDIHLQEAWGHSKPDPVWHTTRLKDIAMSVQGAFDVFSKAQVHLIVDGGDIIHDKNVIPITVFDALCRLINRPMEKIVSVPSNHGMSIRGGQLHFVDAMSLCQHSRPNNGLVSAGLVPKIFDIYEEKVAVYGIQYRPDSDIKEFFADCKRVGNDYKKVHDGKYDVSIIIIHQGIKEARLKNAPFELEKNVSAKKLLKYFKWADLIVAGHYHDPQKLSKRFLIPGAICQHNFKDVGGERGCWIWDSETKELEFIENTEAPKFWSYEYDDLKGKKKLEARDIDFVRVKVRTNRQIEKLREKFGEACNLSFSIVPESTEEQLRDKTMTLSLDDYDLLKKYIEHKDPTALNKEKLKKFGKKVIDFVKDG